MNEKTKKLLKRELLSGFLGFAGAGHALPVRVAAGVLAAMMFTAAAQRPEAQEAGELDMALGIEANNNTPNGAAGGAALALQYSIFRWLAAGIKEEVSYNFDSVLTSETSAVVRWTFLRPAGIALFAEGFGGVSSIKELHARYALRGLGGACAGARFSFGRFYIEPYGGYGWPRLWSGGVNLGFKLRLPGNKEKQKSADDTEAAGNTKAADDTKANDAGKKQAE